MSNALYCLHVHEFNIRTKQHTLKVVGYMEGTEEHIKNTLRSMELKSRKEGSTLYHGVEYPLIKYYLVRYLGGR